MSLIDFLIKNRDRLWRETDGQPSESWYKGLNENWPELFKASKWGAFDQTFNLIRPALETLVELDQENDRLKSLLKKATQKIHNGKSEAAERFLDTQVDTLALPKINGWKVQKSPDGYFRAHRRIGGRMYSCYLGKALDTKTAEEKIKAKEHKIEQGKKKL